ncbi:MAG TPA: hypothetical protein GXZ82_05360 [Firmicutes bacterium]|nr:hypothetical protein [Bacillota bacterium]
MVERQIRYVVVLALSAAIILVTCGNMFAETSGDVRGLSIDLAGEVKVTSRLSKDRIMVEFDKALELHSALNMQVRFSCGYSQDETGLQCGYTLQHATSAIVASLWGGAWSEKGWNDPLQLVRLSGAADGDTRLRLHALDGDMSVDIGTQRAAIRWERQRGGTVGTARLGILAIWGAHGEELDDNTCEEDPLNEACGGNAAQQEIANLGQVDSSVDTPLDTTFNLNRSVAYVAAQTPAWRWQCALAGAACESGCTVAAAGFSARYGSGNWRTELYTKYEETGYRKADAPRIFVIRPTLALTRGSLTAEVRLRAEGEALAHQEWRFILAGRRNITVNQVNSVYTSHQLRTAKTAAWRVLLEVKNNPDDVKETCGAEPCPWLWPDDSISVWSLQAEGIIPTRIGRVGARLKIGESRNGRLNWWYTRPSGERALSSQSHIGVAMEVGYYYQTGAWEYQVGLLFSEEIRFRFNSWERPDAYYWRIEPQVRYINDDYILSGGLNWAAGTEYDGVTYVDCIPVLELTVNL